MKCCLSFIIKTIIAVLVFFGLLHLGVIDFIKEKIEEYRGNEEVRQEKMVDKTKDIVDLSEIEEEYSIEKNLKLLGNRMVIADHKATNQKMIMLEPKNENILTKEDVKSDAIQQKIENALQKYKHQPIKFEEIKVIKKGEMQGFGQKVPYAKVGASVSNIPMMKDVEGIVGVAELENGKNLIVISVNEKGKYSQIIADGFYSKVK